MDGGLMLRHRPVANPAQAYDEHCGKRDTHESLRPHQGPPGNLFEDIREASSQDRPHSKTHVSDRHGERELGRTQLNPCDLTRGGENKCHEHPSQ